MKKVLYLPILILLIGCVSDAPRDNILDPQSKDYKTTANITGFVTTYYQPYLALPHALLTIDSLNYFSMANDNGRYEFFDVPFGEYSLKCSYDNYRSDSITINVDSDNHEIYFRLNALPVIESATISSHHVSRWYPVDDYYYLNVSANANDLDGINEIDSVKIEIPSIGFIDTLNTSGFNGTYQHTFFENQLPVQTIRSLEGVPIYFICWDRVGNSGKSAEHYIPRIVQDVPVLIAPTGLQIINTFPTEFSWEQVYLEYDFELKIEIYQINFGIFSKIREYKNILPNQTTFVVNQALPAGDYFWIIYIVDEFGDTSSSKEGAFRVQ